MSADWYPSTIAVSSDGTPGTYKFMTTVFAPGQHLNYAEFGIYKADTARNICELFPHATLYLFDFDSAVAEAEVKLSEFSNRKFFYGNTQKFNDSYNWSLMNLINENNGAPLFDYCFIDGAHTVAVDALTYFLSDRLLRVGGYMDFGGYEWRLRGSSLDPIRIPEIASQYTDDQIDAFQIHRIVDYLVKRDVRYKQVVANKVFRKITP